MRRLVLFVGLLMDRRLILLRRLIRSLSMLLVLLLNLIGLNRLVLIPTSGCGGLPLILLFWISFVIRRRWCVI